MEIDVTRYSDNREDMIQFSASQHELGPDAGTITWNNSVAEAKLHPLLTTCHEIREAKGWLAEFGAWTKDEIQNWTWDETNALILQFIAGDLREIEHYESLEAYQADENNSGRLYHNEVLGEWWFCIGC